MLNWKRIGTTAVAAAAGTETLLLSLGLPIGNPHAVAAWTGVAVAAALAALRVYIAKVGEDNTNLDETIDVVLGAESVPPPKRPLDTVPPAL